MTALSTTAAALVEVLPVMDPSRAARMRAEGDARPIAYPLGSGQAEEVALAAGLKPAIRQLLRDEDRARARALFERLGLSVEEADCRVHTSTSTAGSIERVVGRVLIAGRDAARVRAIAECERHLFRSQEGSGRTSEMPGRAADAAVILEQGRLLGYPRCCAEAFSEMPFTGGNMFAFRGALSRTREAFHGRVNMLDQGIFHYICWLPCAYDCELSARYADALAARIGTKHPAFVASVDAALSARRLLALEDVQVSMIGRVEGRRVIVERAWPTARDRHPSTPVDPAAREAAARLAALVEEAGSVEVDGDCILVGPSPLVRCPQPLLLPFEPRGCSARK